MSYESTKVIELGSAAFRQWKSKKETGYARQEETNCFCGFIHGYRLVAKLWFSADELDERNWVFDFGDTRELKKTLEYYFDHTMCVAADDPELETFKLMDQKGMCRLRVFKDGVGIERFASFVANIANEYVKELTAGRVRVTKVEMWEHEKNSAIYNNK